MFLETRLVLLMKCISDLVLKVYQRSAVTVITIRTAGATLDFLFIYYFIYNILINNCFLFIGVIILLFCTHFIAFISLYLLFLYFLFYFLSGSHHLQLRI